MEKNTHTNGKHTHTNGRKWVSVNSRLLFERCRAQSPRAAHQCAFLSLFSLSLSLFSTHVSFLNVAIRRVPRERISDDHIGLLVPLACD